MGAFRTLARRSHRRLQEMTKGRERLALLFEKGLEATPACNESIAIQQDVMRVHFPGLPSDLRTTPYLANEDETIAAAAGMGPYLKKCLTVTDGGCCEDTFVSIKLFLGKSLALLDKKERKTHPVQWRKF